MTENTLKGRFVRQFQAEHHNFLVFLHTDKFRRGVPDLSITGRGHTSWWELKYADPTFDSVGIQELTMKRLAAYGGTAFYVIFAEKSTSVTNKGILIVRPDLIGGRWWNQDLWTDWTPGFNMPWLSHFVASQHG